MKPNVAGKKKSVRQRDSDVGYARPPVHRRFKKGVSGNPDGRPKGSKGLRTIMLEALTRTVVMRDGNKTRRISVVQAIILKQIESGLKGNDRAAFALIKMAQQVGLLENTDDGSALSLSNVERQLVDEVLSQIPVRRKPNAK